MLIWMSATQGLPMNGQLTGMQLLVSFLVILLLSSCGGGSGSASVAPPPAPPPPPPPPPAGSITVSTNPVFSLVTMQAPVAMMQAPGDTSRWFVVEQQGIVRIFPNMANVTDADVTVFIDISARVSSGGERGLLGMAFHPGFGNGNFDVFMSYTRNNGGLESALSRFRSNDNGLTLDATMEDIILTIPQDFNNHNGGQIAFGPDGFLYAGWGDGGSGGDPNDRAQDTSNLLGTMTRIDVDGGVPYAIPAGNPFAANAANPCPQGFGGADCPEIYAHGFRNPWRWSFDRQTNDLWVGDVGQNEWEEVDRVTAGGNYGWRCREGAHDFNTTGCAAGLIDPITEYNHNLGQSITGGYVYRGAAIPELQGSYVYADFVQGRIWAIPASSQQGAVGQELLNTAFGISSFAEDNDGELYVIDYGGGVHQIVDVP
jgi:glucose/arabinose dehydrogenase